MSSSNVQIIVKVINYRMKIMPKTDVENFRYKKASIISTYKSVINS